MVKELMHDPIFLAGKSERATRKDNLIAHDLTLIRTGWKNASRVHLRRGCSTPTAQKRVASILDAHENAPNSQKPLILLTFWGWHLNWLYNTYCAS